MRIAGIIYHGGYRICGDGKWRHGNFALPGIDNILKLAPKVLKTDLASSGGSTGGDIPPSMRREITGSALTTTFGWEHNAEVNNAILIPSTFVAVASILIVLVAQGMKSTRGISLEHVVSTPTTRFC